HGCSNFDDKIGEHATADPPIIGGAKRDRHFGALIRIVKDPPEHAGGDSELKNSKQNSFHSPKCFFQISTERRISSGVLRGLISQTNVQSAGRSGTSFGRSTF